MKRLIRILTALMLLVAIPVILFAFFPRFLTWVDTQGWSQMMYLFLIVSAAFALFTGLDLMNRVDVYKEYLSASDKEGFWGQQYAKHRLGFLRSGIGAVLIMAVILVFLIFNLVVLPKAPSASWYLWTIKVLGSSIGVGVLFVLNAVLTLDFGKKVILGIDNSATEKAAKRELTWQDRIFQLRPTFMDAEVDLKEDFDGITELDNPPPPWFMWLFYSTVLFAGVYMVRYAWMKYEPSQTEEYNQAYASYQASKKAALGKAEASVDENTVTLQTDKAKLAEGETVFKTKCATCHGPDGGGLAGSGANLTDEYWIHGNSVKEVFKTIRYGVLSAGMVAWDGQIPPDKMRSVASYVLSLQGTKPANPQPPKGDKMEPKEKF